MRSFSIVLVVLGASYLGCVGSRESGVQEEASSRDSLRTEFIGSIQHVEVSEDELAVTVLVQDVLVSSGHGLSRGSRVEFCTPRRRPWIAFMDTSYWFIRGEQRLHGVEAGEPEQTGNAQGTDHGPARLLPYEREWLEALHELDVLVVYHDAYEAVYRGRLSVWRWAGGRDDFNGTEFLARLLRVEPDPALGWWLTVSVTRVLTDLHGNVAEGDVVTFQWRHPQLLSPFRSVDAGMEAEFQDEFRIVFHDRFAQPYSGLTLIFPW